MRIVIDIEGGMSEWGAASLIKSALDKYTKTKEGKKFGNINVTSLQVLDDGEWDVIVGIRKIRQKMMDSCDDMVMDSLDRMEDRMRDGR